MNREDFIKRLITFGSQRAKEIGYTEVLRGEDRQKGVWGENFTKFLEKEAGGDCSSTIKWYNPDKEKDCIEFYFRFNSPCILRRWYSDGYECLVCFDFTNKKLVNTGETYQEDGYLHKKGEQITEFVEDRWRLSQVMSWNFDKEEVAKVFEEWKRELLDLIKEANN